MTKSACHRLTASSVWYTTTIIIRVLAYVPRTQHSPVFILFDCHKGEEAEKEEDEEEELLEEEKKKRKRGSGKRW